MSSHKRPTLENQFGDLGLGSSSRSSRALSPSKFPSPTKIKTISSIRRSIAQAGFPNWRTLRGLSTKSPEPCNFTLHMSDNYRYYQEATQEDHDVVFERASAIIGELRATLTSNSNSVDAYSDFTMETMAHLVFGSNMQERAGQSLDITIKICREIFMGRAVDPSAIDPRTPEYAAQLAFLRHQGNKNPDLEAVVRSRAEIVQHAQALKFITDAALNGDRPLTEELILETHRILCYGESYAGKWRTRVVRVGKLLPCDYTQVPQEMQKLIDGFNLDIKERESSKELDPFFLAADICQDFVMIHPFEDGNGRMCRMIANAFLIKYAGIMISIGEHEEDREEYLKICQLADDPDTEEIARGTLARFFLDKAEPTLRRLCRKISRK